MRTRRPVVFSPCDGAAAILVSAALLFAGEAAAQGIDHRIRGEGSPRVSTRLDPAAERVSSRKITDGKYHAGPGLSEVRKLDEETLSGRALPGDEVIFVEPVEGEIERREDRKKKKIF